MTLNDRVETIHRLLISDESYLDKIRAVYDSESTEGSLAVDDVLAALAIRNKAREVGEFELAEIKLDTILRALNVVLRRYNASRKQRRE